MRATETGFRPIETEYAGCRFRSRLEARWAVFYDALDIHWGYEVEGFSLGDGRGYLPDFYLPKLDCFIEVKPNEPTPYEVELAEALCLGTRKRVFIFAGNIPWLDATGHVEPTATLYFLDDWGIYPEVVEGANVDDYYYWCRCQRCGAFGIEYGGRWCRIDCGCTWKQPKEGRNLGDDPMIVEAYRLARSCRFDERRGRRQGSITHLQPM